MMLSGIENIIGSAFNDTLTGTTGANVMDGGAGNDSLSGLAGADTLVGGEGYTLTGGAGNDSLDGGIGIDTAVYSGNRADYVVSVVDGIGTVTSVAGRRGHAERDRAAAVRRSTRHRCREPFAKRKRGNEPDITPTEGQQLTADLDDHGRRRHVGPGVHVPAANSRRMRLTRTNITGEHGVVHAGASGCQPDAARASALHRRHRQY